MDQTLGETTPGADGPGESAGWLEAERRYLMAVARRRLGGDLAARETASDLVQRTFLVAISRDEALRKVPGPKRRAWLRGTLLNVLREVRRHHQAAKRPPAAGQAEQAPEPAADTTSPSGKAARAEDLGRLAAAIARLDPRDRDVLAWHRDEGCTFQEIARRLGSSTATAYNTYARALRRLRQEFDRGA